MNKSESAIGVDACPYGWCATTLSGDGVSTELVEKFSTIREEDRDASIFVDIPIGLPTASRRRCDEDAKVLLGCRGISVFYPPCEEAIEFDDYDRANDAHKEKMGNGLSQQAHSISEKIREVAEVVDEPFNGQIRESHPELCFYALNGQPIAYPKSSDRGHDSRLYLLEDTVPGAETEYDRVVGERLRKEVRKDDILDSIALAIAAKRDRVRTVPEKPDDGEPRIYYPEPSTLAGGLTLKE